MIDNKTLTYVPVYFNTFHLLQISLTLFNIWTSLAKENENWCRTNESENELLSTLISYIIYIIDRVFMSDIIKILKSKL